MTDQAPEQSSGLFQVSFADLVELYNKGYHAGHHDTVESCYTDVFPVDMRSYHSDTVDELIEESGITRHPQPVDGDKP